MLITYHNLAVRFLGWWILCRRDRPPTPVFLGLPGGSGGKESTCNAGNLGLIPGLGRSPGEGNGYPLQYSGLENFMDCIFHGVAKSQTRLSDFHFIGYTFTCLSNRHISGKVFLTQFELMFPPLWFHGLISISLTHYLISHLDLRIFIPLLFLKIWVCLTGMILPYSLL